MNRCYSITLCFLLSAAELVVEDTKHGVSIRSSFSDPVKRPPPLHIEFSNAMYILSFIYLNITAGYNERFEMWPVEENS